MKLTPAMQKAMDALPLSYTVWGGSPFATSFPKGVTMKTINALENCGLVKIVRVDVFDRKVVKVEK